MAIREIQSSLRVWKCTVLLFALAGSVSIGRCADSKDPLLDLMIQKGMLTQDEANKVRAEADALRTNPPAPADAGSKWTISKAIKNIELYGDVRLRFENREAFSPADTRIELNRGRFALRFGLRGEVFDDFYYGLRLDTSSNPRSPWATFGSSSPGPFGKSSYGLAVGQAYIGWHPGTWLDITAGKMPNPLFTTPMVWDPDLNPEGFAERFKYTVGTADFFANFGQFVYQDNNPSFISGSLVQPIFPNGARTQSSADNTFMLAWQGGVNYHFNTNTSLKVGPAVYQYFGLVTNASVTAGVSPNGLGEAFIGEGSFGGPNSPAPINGLTTQNGILYNQVGINHLLVLDVPLEFNFKLGKLNARLFGDYAINLDGSTRAEAAVNQLAATTAGTGSNPPLLQNGAQRNDIHAYQGGFAIGNKDLGLVYGTTSRKHAWEFRTYYQHIEQYALDPNLLDSDFFEGRSNLEGIYAAVAYGITDNIIGTFRYGYAWRINDKLGTGGSNLDIPQINPISHYNLLQVDLTFRF